jgi:MFS family permease
LFLIYLFVSAVCCGGLFGLTATITSGIILESPWSILNDFALGIMSAAVLIGAAIGCFFGGFVADAIGPKKTLFISGLISFVCSVALCIQKHVVALIVLRGITGLGLGCVSAVGPLYVGEQSPAKYRGMFVAIYQLSITIGILLSYGVNFLFSSTIEDGKDG